MTFNAWREDDPACMHGETIRVQGGDDITIRNNTFRGPSDAGSGQVFVKTQGREIRASRVASAWRATSSSR